jgi:quercetin dioxygenase-like cupin family protein
MNTDIRHASQPVDAESIPWIPLGPGESFKPLAFLPNDRGRVLLLRLEPGTLVPRHRHSGEVHGLNLQGRRELIESGEIVGPGGYVYEPAGNIDSWRAIGDEPVIVHIIAYGGLEYLGDHDEVLRRDDAASLRLLYERYCAEHQLDAPDLVAKKVSSR